MDRPVLSSRRVAVAVALAGVLLAILAYHGRRATIRAFFVDGSSDARLPEAAPGRPIARAERVRVVLLDGLLATTAETLPNLARLCGEGSELAVDSGFPTVSLPVQHVLWTGLTQQQSGLWYRIPRLDSPPDDALPVRIPGSRAVAESHADIVNSFGFSSALPADDEAPWSEEQFTAAARDLVASETRLGFVHVLRIDEAGHDYGAISTEYEDAARWADARLGEWVGLAPPGTRWLVLADHGHLDGGGHGGAEPDIRIVRACFAGSVPDDLPERGQMHLIDVSRALHDSLGLQLSGAAAGRPFHGAVAEPAPGATIPRPSGLRWGLAALVLAVGLAFAGYLAEGGWAWAPWWIPVAYLSLLLLHGQPSLSNPTIYPPWGLDLLVSGLPGFCLLLFLGWRLAEGHAIWRVAGAKLLPVLGLVLSCGILCGAPQFALGLTQAPPLMPTWTAHTSVALSLSLGAGAVVAVLGAAVAARGGRTATSEH